MLRLHYTKIIPCTLYEVFSQYYDYEHIEHVHPHTLGRYELVENQDNGTVVTYDQIWPWRKGRSRVRHTYRPPLSMTFEFLAGRHQGVRVETQLSPAGEQSTRIEEAYWIPGLPAWRWLAPLVRPSVMWAVNRIWEEDLAVDVCIEGWPGIPSAARAHLDQIRRPLTYASLPNGFAVESVPDGQLKGFLINGQPAVIARVNGVLIQLPARCPHTGGPLALGQIENGATACVICPWHGARFEVHTGRRIAGPPCADLTVRRFAGNHLEA